MTYLFNTADQTAEMLAAIGVDSVDAFFEQIPESQRLDRPLDLPRALTEPELQAEILRLAAKNTGASGRACFLGGGVYDHFIPAVVDEIAGRGEFYTAYTPYQAEASQGSLQAFFEFQSMICSLTGMDVSNASLYEGGTAVSEAAFMAMRVTGRHGNIVVLGSLHPEFRQILQTYLMHLDTELRVVPTPNGTANLDDVKSQLDDKTACLIVQHPNFFGCLEDAAALTDAAHAAGALSVVSFDPVSLGVLKRPGDYGADVAVAEGQSLGIPFQYGGPFLGIMTCTTKCMRKMPGRLIGETTDRDGRTCYVLNLQAREQHIRREKATSNICTNQGLLALRATVHLASLGPQGLREVSELSCQKAHYAADRLAEIDGVSLKFDAPFFKEFTLQLDRPVDDVIAVAQAAGYDIGPSLKRVDDTSEDGLLVAVTEIRTKQEIDGLVKALGR